MKPTKIYGQAIIPGNVIVRNRRTKHRLPQFLDLNELRRLASQQDPAAMQELCKRSNTPVPEWAK